MSGKFSPVTDADFDQRVLESTTPVLVDFHADWCFPCKQLAPMLDDMVGEFGGELVIHGLDVGANPGVRDRYGIRGIPALLIFKDGKIIARSQSHSSRTELASFIEKALSGAAK